jgi:two-component system, OmpR family, sensor kinase
MAALGAAVIVAILTTAALLVLVQNQQAASATLLADTVRHADDVVDPPSGMWLAFETNHTVSVSPNIPPGLPDRDALDLVRRTGRVDIRDITVAGTRFRVRTEARPSAIVQAGLDLGSDRVQSISILRALLLLGGAGLILAAVGGTWVGRRALRPLTSALALQRRFVADASHELRTPVTLLSTRAQLIRRRADKTASTAFLDEVDGLVEDAQQLGAVLEDLLVVADQGRETPTMVDLTELSYQVVASSTSYARDHGVRIVANSGPVAPVLGSAIALRRALTALVDNAVRHARTTVTLEVTRTRDQVIVDVRDDGPGIAPDIEPRLFERFASTTATDNGNGITPRYGLGLALVRDVASRHRGTVAAVRTTQQGANLRLTLPAAEVVTERR